MNIQEAVDMAAKIRDEYPAVNVKLYPCCDDAFYVHVWRGDGKTEWQDVNNSLIMSATDMREYEKHKRVLEGK